MIFPHNILWGRKDFLQIINWDTKGKSIKIFRYSTSLLLNYLVKGTIKLRWVPNYLLWIFSWHARMLKWGSLKPGFLCLKLINFINSEHYSFVFCFPLFVCFFFLDRSGFSSYRNIKPFHWNFVLKATTVAKSHEIVFPDRTELMP